MRTSFCTYCTHFMIKTYLYIIHNLLGFFKLQGLYLTIPAYTIIIFIIKVIMQKRPAPLGCSYIIDFKGACL